MVNDWTSFSIASVSAESRTTPCAVRRALEGVQERLSEGAVLPFRKLLRQFVLLRRGQNGHVFHVHGVLKDFGVGILRPALSADRAGMAGVEQQQHLAVRGERLSFFANSLAETALLMLLPCDPASKP